MTEHEEDLARLMTLENGKTLAEAKVRLVDVIYENWSRTTILLGRERLQRIFH